MKQLQVPSLARSPSGDHRVVLGPGLPALPERLLLAHAEGRVLFIAGAGVSMQAPSCLPDFGRLVRRVFAQLDQAIGAHLEAPPGSLPPLDPEQTAMLRRIEDKEFDVALGMLERRMDRDQEKESTVRRAVAGILRQAGRHAPVHTSLVRLADRGGEATIATTNFDLLLERAARALRTPLQRYALQDIPRPSLRPEFGGVLHLHGALDPDPARHADFVLTDRDFGEHYMRRRAIPDLIYDAVRIFHVVLVGYSLGDPPMRYLLNAVAADGQRFSDLKERFAFVGMDAPFDEAALATWKGRGITPIPYDQSGGHRALAEVLAAWAALSPHGGDRADKEVRRILRIPRVAASEASAALFGHLFRRSGDDAQVRIAATAREVRADPAWLDGMLEIVRERGGAADREGHASRLCQVALHGRFVDADMLRWAARLPPELATERSAVLAALRWRSPRDTPEPWRGAWEAIADAHSAPAAGGGDDRREYELGRRLREGDRTGGLIAGIAQLAAPRLRVEWRTDAVRFGRKVPRQPRRVVDLLHLALTSGTVEIDRALGLDGVDDVAFLLELGDALEAEVVRGLHLGRRIGWHAGRDFAWLGGLTRVHLRRGAEGGSDRFHRGIAPAVRLLMHTVARLADLDPAAARPFLHRWRTRTDHVHARLWAAAAVEPALAGGDEVGRFLLGRPPEQAWDAVRFPEVAELRAVRFPDLGDAERSEIIGGLLRGPPVSLIGRRGAAEERRRWRTGAVVRELTRIEAAGAALPPRAIRWLHRRRSEFEGFVAGSVAAGFPTGVSVGWVAPNPATDLDGLDGADLAATADERLRAAPSPWDGPGRGVWDWLDGSGHASRLAKALLSIDGHLERFGKAWDALGRRHQPPGRGAVQEPTPLDTLSEVREILHTIPRMSASVLEDAAAGLAAWVAGWVQHLRTDEALPAAIAKLWPFAAAMSGRTTDATEYEVEEGAEAKRIEHDALNAPVGDLAGAFLLACPDLAETPRPFEADAALRTVRDLVGSTEGRAGTVARYQCATRLPYLMRADGAWAEAVLLSRLEAGPESDILWHAVARSPFRPDVMARLGRLMARRAAAGGLEAEVRRSLVERVCYAMLGGMWNGRADTVLLPDAQQMLRSVSEDLRAHAALVVERFIDDITRPRGSAPHAREEVFDRAVERFLREVWPQERAAVTPAVARAFAAVPAASGRRFARAVAAVRRFLVPFETWSLHDWGLLGGHHSAIRTDAVVGAEEAAAALDLLDLTIGTSPDVRAPPSLDAALAHLIAQDAALRRDPRFARLSALARP